MKRIAVLFFLIIRITVHAQEQTASALSIGEKLPDIDFHNLINYIKPGEQMPQFQDKLIILDFWNKFCASCIANFPKMEELQNEFEDKIQIVLVTNDTKSELKRLFEISPNVKNARLPMIIGDTILHKLFPHIAVPFHVWISPNGTVEHTTQGWNTSKVSVKQYLEGRKTGIANLDQRLSKKQLNLPILQQMILANQNVTDGILGYSLLTRRSKVDPRSGVGFGLADANDSVDWAGSTLQNYTIVDLFSRTVGLLYQQTPQKILLELSDTANLSKYYPPTNANSNNAWIDSNSYCFEFQLPYKSFQYDLSVQKIKYQYMLSQLESYFSIKSKLVDKEIPCYILYRKSNQDLLKSKDTSIEAIYDKTPSKYIIRNNSITSVVNVIKVNYANVQTSQEIPVLEETGYTGKVDLELRYKKHGSLEDFKKELSKFGLGIKCENRNVKCLVLSEL